MLPIFFGGGFGNFQSLLRDIVVVRMMMMTRMMMMLMMMMLMMRMMRMMGSEEDIYTENLTTPTEGWGKPKQLIANTKIKKRKAKNENHLNRY